MLRFHNTSRCRRRRTVRVITWRITVRRGKIQPQHQVRTLGQKPTHRTVLPLGHPGRLTGKASYFGFETVERNPVGPVEQRVQLSVFDLEKPPDSTGESRLSGTGSPRDKDLLRTNRQCGGEYERHRYTLGALHFAVHPFDVTGTVDRRTVEASPVGVRADVSLAVTVAPLRVDLRLELHDCPTVIAHLPTQYARHTHLATLWVDVQCVGVLEHVELDVVEDLRATVDSPNVGELARRNP